MKAEWVVVGDVDDPVTGTHEGGDFEPQSIQEMGLDPVHEFPRADRVDGEDHVAAGEERSHRREPEILEESLSRSLVTVWPPTLIPRKNAAPTNLITFTT